MKKNLFFLFVFVGLLMPNYSQADSLSGVVRTVNYGSSSFGLDVPPLTRIYINSGTSYKMDGRADSFRSLKSGDKVKVKGRVMATGTFLASQVKVTGHVEEVKDLVSDAIKIKLNQRFLMGVSQTAVLKQNGKKALVLRSTEFVNTLCKDGYDCSGEGEVGMRLDVKGSGEKNEVILTSKNHRKPTKPVKVQLYGYEIQLVEAGEDVVLLVVRQAS